MARRLWLARTDWRRFARSTGDCSGSCAARCEGIQAAAGSLDSTLPFSSGACRPRRCLKSSCYTLNPKTKPKTNFCCTLTQSAPCVHARSGLCLACVVSARGERECPLNAPAAVGQSLQEDRPAPPPRPVRPPDSWPWLLDMRGRRPFISEVHLEGQYGGDSSTPIKGRLSCSKTVPFFLKVRTEEHAYFLLVYDVLLFRAAVAVEYGRALQTLPERSRPAIGESPR